MTRFPDWPERLDAWVMEARTRPFVRGRWDCCLAACSAVEALTGHDPAAGFRGAYTTRRGAVAALRRFSGAGLLETARKIAAELGSEEIAPRLAQRGDVVLLSPPEGEESLGVCIGAQVATVTLGGFRLLPLAGATYAWRV